ncbi:DUF4236 domain-containing protein [Leifsonia soli]|uniref:DUF4236 domain-containing protein n=1 Tax=Leifsonia soli TaxID=582665 RepID=A0A852T0T0_9MICO|nr:hypothetical protein [Leifsonia soli]
MGFYIRKSLKAGPFRFNLSKSGLGVSAGVPGFRVGSGPRGNYVHMGAGGVYYRASLNGRVPVRATQPVQPASPTMFSASAVLMEDVTGADVQELEPTGPDDVVRQLREASNRHGIAWWVALAASVVGAFIMPFGWILWVLAIPGVWWLALRDRARQSVVVFYDVNDEAAARFQALVDADEHLRGLAGRWRITQSGAVGAGYQHKVNAGASNLVRREPVTVGAKAPKQLVTNVAVPSWTAGQTTLYFLPDRVLVKQGKEFTDVGYTNLQVTDSTTRFIESAGPVLRDTKQVGSTWQYVNKGGGPDRRFANNPALPIVLYGEVLLATASGFRWEMQISKSESAAYIGSTLRYIAGR